GLGSLSDDLLEQIGAGLGECELAEARIDGSEVGVDIWLKVLFFMMFPFVWLGGVLVFCSFLWPLP
ncbi:hypothetical protein LEA_12768, partial [human gut metagenome]